MSLRTVEENGVVSSQGQHDPPSRDYLSRGVTEVAIYALSSVIVLYVLALGWLITVVSQAESSRTESVFVVIVMGLAAPLCPWALRVAIRLQGKQSSREFPDSYRK